MGQSTLEIHPESHGLDLQPLADLKTNEANEIDYGPVLGV